MILILKTCTIINTNLYWGEIMKKEQLDRINELAKKKKTIGLSDQEAAEQRELYQIYLNNIKSQIINSLDKAGYQRSKDQH